MSDHQSMQEPISCITLPYRHECLQSRPCSCRKETRMLRLFILVWATCAAAADLQPRVGLPHNIANAEVPHPSYQSSYSRLALPFTSVRVLQRGTDDAVQ